MIEEGLRQFILSEMPWDGSREELTYDAPLLTSGVVDSIGLFNIVSFIENEFSLEILDDELIPENFGTIRDIAHLVRSKVPGNVEGA